MTYTPKQLNGFVAYCKENLNFKELILPKKYESLSICIIDCIYSLRAKYDSVTIPVVKRYAKEYMGGNRFSSGDTTKDLIEHIKLQGGCKGFSGFLGNHQKSGGIEKSEICYNLAQKLCEKNIITLDDFKKQKPEYLESIIKPIKGIGPAALNYLFILAGDPDRCKPDVHIKRFIRDALGTKSIANGDCQCILEYAVKELKSEYKELTVRQLDWLIWDKGQKEARKRKLL